MKIEFIPTVLTLVALFLVYILTYGTTSGKFKVYEDRPCNEFANSSVRFLPARCLSYFYNTENLNK